VWARAVETTKSLDRKTVAEAIRGKTIKGTLLGDVTFAPNGQMQSHHTLFRVVDGQAMKLEVLK
jgi:branched-chain amino acid transport system substrate-binding protein